MTLSDRIMSEAKKAPQGRLVSPVDFLDAAPRGSVDKAMSRLVQRGKLVRIGRSLYAASLRGERGPYAPPVEKVLASLSKRTGETFVPQGSMSANLLGLSKHVPLQTTWLTSGKSRTLRFGKGEVQIKNAPVWKISLGNRPAGDLVRALDSLGPKEAERVLADMPKTFPGKEWKALDAARPMLPAWMSRLIGKVLP